ncbi:hypothetical protein BD779DRAFT_1510833 [Infundibulicybe gibba]|nr:hypothetical protein BD779DRAFT_1510833 [Infundibulicybe gibba]
MQDPPFLTDGRGRVVWSSTSVTTNCDAGAVVIPNAEENSDDLVDTTNDEGEDTDGEESDSSINPFTLLSRMFGAFFF